jgi:Fe-S cluster biogenesis protein NfuA
MQHDVQEASPWTERIEALVEKVARFSDADARATSEELLQTVLEMYGEGIARLLERVYEYSGGDTTLLEKIADDELVCSLLLLHGLHPLTLEQRIARGIAEVRPYLEKHGGNVELLRIADNVAYLQLQGSCQGCSSSTTTLKMTIEETLYRVAPDLERIETVDASTPAAQPLIFLSPRRKRSEATAVQQTG